MQTHAKKNTTWVTDSGPQNVPDKRQTALIGFMDPPTQEWPYYFATVWISSLFWSDPDLVFLYIHLEAFSLS